VARGEGCGVDFDDDRIPASLFGAELAGDDVWPCSWLVGSPGEFGPPTDLQFVDELRSRHALNVLALFVFELA